MLPGRMARRRGLLVLSQHRSLVRQHPGPLWHGLGHGGPWRMHGSALLRRGLTHASSRAAAALAAGRNGLPGPLRRCCQQPQSLYFCKLNEFDVLVSPLISK